MQKSTTPSQRETAGKSSRIIKGTPRLADASPRLDHERETLVSRFFAHDGWPPAGADQICIADPLERH